MVTEFVRPIYPNAPCACTQPPNARDLLCLVVSRPACQLKLMLCVLRILCVVCDLVIMSFKRYKKIPDDDTKVDECTKADTDVGAAIAAGIVTMNNVFVLFWLWLLL